MKSGSRNISHDSVNIIGFIYIIDEKFIYDDESECTRSRQTYKFISQIYAEYVYVKWVSF